MSGPFVEIGPGTNRPRLEHPAANRSRAPIENDATVEEMSEIISSERRRRATIQARLEVAAEWLAIANHLAGCKRRGVADCACGLWAARKAVEPVGLS
jgi:hypothetical protein